VSVAVGQGTMAPEGSLHFKVMDFPYMEGDDALDARAADHMSCVTLASPLLYN
jgi:hypothetical protein